MTRQQGLSLTEIIISLLLASLLLLALMQHYLSSKRHYLHSQQLLEQSYEWLFVDNFLRQSLRRAGFSPCLGLNLLKTIDQRNGKTNLVSIEAETGAGQGLRIHRMSDNFTAVLQILSSNRLVVSAENQRVGTRDILIADCYHAEVQRVLSRQQVAKEIVLTLEKPLAFDYVVPFYMGDWVDERIFIQTNTRGKPALFYQQDQPEELTSMIQSMSTHLQTKQGQHVVQLRLGLANQQSILLETMVRSQ